MGLCIHVPAQAMVQFEVFCPCYGSWFVKFYPMLCVYFMEICCSYGYMVAIIAIV